VILKINLRLEFKIQIFDIPILFHLLKISFNVFKHISIRNSQIYHSKLDFDSNVLTLINETLFHLN